MSNITNSSEFENGLQDESNYLPDKHSMILEFALYDTKIEKKSILTGLGLKLFFGSLLLMLETSVGDPDPQIRDPDPRIFTGIQIRKRSAIIFMRILYLRILNIPSKYELKSSLYSIAQMPRQAIC